MSDTQPTPTLLDELDARQNMVLQELDELNVRVEALIHEFAPSNRARKQHTFPADP